MNLPEYASARVRLAVLLAIPLAFTALFFALNLGAEHNGNVILDLQLIHSRVSALRSISNEAEVGEYGYLLTENAHYLAILEGVGERLNSETNTLNSTPMTNALRERVNNLISLVRRRLELSNKIVAAERTAGQAVAIEAARTDNAEVIMDQIRDQVEILIEDVSAETKKHLDENDRLTHWTFLLFLIGTVVMLAVLMFLYNWFAMNLQARDAAHAQLTALNIDLEKRIASRTAELQRFNEELQQFAYVASHDLQEPLRTVTSFAQLLESRYKNRLDEDADEFIGYIVSSSHRMTDLINGLLALVRLRKAGKAVDPVPFAGIVSESEVSLQALIRENDARIEAGDLPSLVVDRLQFAQVFQNLISNAIKYRREEPPLIRIGAHRDSSNWIFSVSDNGRGFDPQFAERIFGLFQRLHGREVEGTGMGLSIARKIVERHGGRMWAESREGAGSTFYFSLPASLEAKLDDEPTGVQQTASART